MLPVVLVELDGRHPLLSRGPQLLDDGCDSFTIDLRGLEFASPLDLAGIASLAERGSSIGPVRVRLPDDAAVASYMARMNLLEHLPEGVSLEGHLPRGARRPLDKVLVEIRRVTLADVEQVWEQFGEVALAQFGTLAIPVFKATGELLGNAVSHGGQPGTVTTAAQYYTGRTSGREGLEVAICDTGVGVLDHLRRNPRNARITTHEAALKAAFRERTTGVVEDEDRGFGLTDVLQLIGSLDAASLVLASGDTALVKRWRNALFETRVTKLATPIEGTWAWLQVRLSGGEQGVLQ